MPSRRTLGRGRGGRPPRRIASNKRSKKKSAASPRRRARSSPAAAPRRSAARRRARSPGGGDGGGGYTAAYLRALQLRIRRSPHLGALYLEENKARTRLNIVHGAALATVGDDAAFMRNPTYRAAKVAGRAWAAFRSPGGTWLVAPTARCSDVSAFAAGATPAAWLAFWAGVLETRAAHGGFISTHGHGVPQLHVRIEPRPAFYTPR